MTDAAECGGGYAGAVAASLNRAATAVLTVFLEPYEIPAEPVKFALEAVMFVVLGVPLLVGSVLSYMCFEPELKSVRDNVVLVMAQCGRRPRVPVSATRPDPTRPVKPTPVFGRNESRAERAPGTGPYPSDGAKNERSTCF